MRIQALALSNLGMRLVALKTSSGLPNQWEPACCKQSVRSFQGYIVVLRIHDDKKIEMCKLINNCFRTLWFLRSLNDMPLNQTDALSTVKDESSCFFANIFGL
jgi:hypothetical protein